MNMWQAQQPPPQSNPTAPRPPPDLEIALNASAGCAALRSPPLSFSGRSRMGTTHWSLQLACDAATGGATHCDYR